MLCAKILSQEHRDALPLEFRSSVFTFGEVDPEFAETWVVVPESSFVTTCLWNVRVEPFEPFEPDAT